MLAFLIGGAAAETSCEPVAGRQEITYVGGQTACFQGQITAGSQAALVELYRREPFKRLLINSLGGDVEEAVAIGRFVFANGIDIEVLEICFSSCANYIFPAGSTKRIRPGGLVAWHGVPGAVAGGHKDASKRATQLSDAFFRDMAINKRLFDVVPRNDRRNINLYSQRNRGWTYSKADLESVVGIRDLISDYEISRSDVKRAELKYGLTIIVGVP